MQLDTGILNKRSSEFHHVALKYTKICSLVEYIGETLQSMNEGWEDSLLKVDRKLAAYSEVSLINFELCNHSLCIARVAQLVSAFGC